MCIALFIHGMQKTSQA